MATNDPFDNHDGSNPFRGLLHAAAALTPIGIAGYSAYHKIKGNAALNPIKAATASGNLPRVGHGLGKALPNLHDGRIGRLNDAKELIEQFLQPDHIRKLFQSVEEQRAVIQSLISAMDDPGSGFAEGIVTSYKEQLVELAQNSVAGADSSGAEEAITSIVRAMNDTASPEAKGRWAANLREFREVGGQLAPPMPAMKAGERYNRVDSSHPSLKAGTAARGRYDQLLEMLGGVGKRGFNLVETEGSVYARVHTGGGKHLATLALHLASTGQSYSRLRMGEDLQTAYLGNKYYMEAEHARGMMNRGMGFDQFASSRNMMGVEDVFLKEFGSIIKVGEGGVYMGRGDKQKFGAWRREFLEPEARIVGSGKPFSAAAGMTEHLQQAASFRNNNMTIVGMERLNRSQRDELISGLPTNKGFEYSGSPGKIMRRTADNRYVGQVGIRSGSAINALQTSTGADRGMYPVVSRVEQIVGREGLFVGQGGKRMGRGGVLARGATFSHSAAGGVVRTGNNIEWAKSVTGATNKAVLMDVSGKIHEGLSGLGVAYHSGRDTLRNVASKPLLDPGTQKNLSTKLLNRILAQDPGQMITLTRQELMDSQGFLGMGPAGTQSLRIDPRTHQVQLGHEVMPAGGKKQINIKSITDRNMETAKLFSTAHKGTTQQVERHRMMSMIGEYGVDEGMLKGLQVSTDDLLITSGDMLKKGAGFFTLQMESGYGMVSGDENYMSNLMHDAKTSRYGLGDSKLARTTGAVISRLAAKGSLASAQEAGLVLAPILMRGHDSKWVKGENTLKAGAVETAIKSAFGSRAGAVLAQARKGLGIGATSAVAGMGVGDKGVMRGSIEPRFIENLQHRLGRMGMSEADTSEFLASIYKRKVGWQEHITSAKGMMKMAESVMGKRDVIDATSDAVDGMKTYGLQDIAKIATSEESITDFLKGHQDGFLLDLTQGADTKATHAIASAAQDVFVQGQLRIPGADVMNAMRETSIKVADGQHVNVQGEFAGMIDNLMASLDFLSNNTKAAQEESKFHMEQFKKDTLQLFSKTYHGVAAGKIKGFTGNVAGAYNLKDQSHFSTPERFEFARAMDKRTKGMGIWHDSKAFLNMTSDFMGSGGATSDMVKQAEMFFLSSEGMKSTDARGIASLTSRHPMLSLGNVAPTQILRHVEEVGRGAGDETFKAFTGTDVGRDALKKLSGALGTNISGFGELARHKGKGATNEFLGSLLENVKSYMGEGGGQSFMGTRKHDVHYDGGTFHIDFGVAASAMGDMDGDDFFTMPMGKKSGKLMEAMASDGWQDADSVYKIKSEIYAQQAKAGLSSHTAKAGSAVAEDILKEKASKELVGSLDISFNKLRKALLNSTDTSAAGRSAVEEALALLKVTQEHAVIKGKKLEVFRPFAERLTKGIDILMDEGDISPLRHVMETEIFPGTDIIGKGIQINAQDVNQLPGHLQGAVRSMASSGPVQLKNAMATLEQAAASARSSGISNMVSSGQIAKVLGGGDSLASTEAMNLLKAGETMQGGIIGGTSGTTAKSVAASAGTAVSRIQAAARRMDGKTMGLAAMGIAGSMAAIGLMTGGGYAAKPLTMPGEVVSPQVRESLASGNAFRGQQVGPTPESMQRKQDRYAMMNRPINSGTTYMNRPNHYQIRGQIPTSRGIDGIQSFMSGLPGGGGRGSVTINDTLRPITSNYMDRLLGEY